MSKTRTTRRLDVAELNNTIAEPPAGEPDAVLGLGGTFHMPPPAPPTFSASDFPAAVEAEAAAEAPPPGVPDLPAAVEAPPPGTADLAPGNTLLTDAVDATTAARVSSAAWAVVLGALALCMLYGLTEAGHTLVFSLALFAALTVAYPVQRGLAYGMMSWLGAKVWVKTCAVVVLAGLLVLTGGWLWEWVATLAIIGLLVSSLRADAAAAAAQTAVIDIE